MQHYYSAGVYTCMRTVLSVLAMLAVSHSVLAQSHSPTMRLDGSHPLQTLRVPLVYESPGLGRVALTLDFGAPFRKDLPTVLVIADGQQFYVQPGAMAALQKSTFGNNVNVVGIVTRGMTAAFIDATLDAQGKPDWLKAWQIFNSNEWIGDIESVRKALVGENGKIYLYGRSGGAYLVHQYLTKHAGHVNKAFTQSAVNPFINAELGIGLDRFWSDLGEQAPRLQEMLRTVLLSHPSERAGILMTLQRQHFFVSADSIKEARATLIDKLSAGDLEFYKQARKDYQVDDMITMAQTKEIIPQNVRVLELIGPSGAFGNLNDGRIYPLIETQRDAIRPLIDLQTSGKIKVPVFDFVALHHCLAQVFILAGRYDEAVDYRTNIALASEYPFHELFIANDNHVFSTLVSAGMSKRLIESFFNADGSTEIGATLKDAQKYRWIEQ